MNNSTGLGGDLNTRAGTTPAPLLVPMDALGYNGGLTPTHVLIGGANPALNAGSTALAVSSSGQALSTDQRGTGYPRVLGNSVDAGATEGYWANASPGLTGFTLSGPTGNISLRSQQQVAWSFTTVPVGTTISIYADPDATVNGNEIYLGSGIAADGLVKQFSWYAVSLPVGSYTLGAIVTDSHNGLTASYRLASPTVVQNAWCYTVNSTADVVAADGVVTLREAIMAANSHAVVGDAPAWQGTPGTDVVDLIRFDPSLNGKTITLAGSELPVSDRMAIQGLDPNGNPVNITISSNSLSRVFNISAGAGNVWVSGVTLTGGYNSSGGAIYNGGASLSLQNATIQNSTGVSGCGGAVDTAAGGNLQAQSCSFLSDSTSGFNSNYGGAIYMGGATNTSGTIWSGAADLNQCTFTGNSASYTYYSTYGGAVYAGGSNGSATITNSSFTGNSAYQGGAIYSGGNYTVSASDSSFTSNSGGNCGGALDGSFTLLRDTLTGNAAGTGGAWYGSGTMTDSTVMNNSAYSGGGIEVTGNLTVMTSTVAGNTATGSSGTGGGIDNGSSYQVNVYESTISGNRATGSSSLGGGINNSGSGTLTLVQSTVTLYQASQGGGVYNSGTAVVQNTIVAGNTATAPGRTCGGVLDHEHLQRDRDRQRLDRPGQRPPHPRWHHARALAGADGCPRPQRRPDAHARVDRGSQPGARRREHGPGGQ